MPDDPSEITIDSAEFSGPAALAMFLFDRQEAKRLPVWVRAGRTRSRVTPENVDGVRKGLLIASDMAENR